MGDLQRVLSLLKAIEYVHVKKRGNDLVFYGIVPDNTEWIEIWDIFLNGLREDDLKFNFKSSAENDKFIISVSQYNQELLIVALKVIVDQDLDLSSGNAVFNKRLMSLADKTLQPIGVSTELELKIEFVG